MSEIQKKYETDFKDDALDIWQDVIEFAHLISRDKYIKGKGSKVYSISAKFGIGKTFFCEKLYKVLKKDNIRCAIFNVWKSDFYEDPMIPILSELNRIYILSNPGCEPLPTEIVKHRSWLKVVASGIKLKGKATIPGVGEIGIDIDGSKMVDEHTRQTTASEQSTENNISIYDEYSSYEFALNDLKDALKEWIKQHRKPIVLIIDELDRCRPDYAVKALEAIKHFFDISGLVFVLAIDEEQLKNSVHCLYGTTDFDGYKRKFISNSFRLAEPNNLKFAEMLYDKSGIEEFIKIHTNNRTEVLISNKTEAYIQSENPAGGRYKIIPQPHFFPDPFAQKPEFPSSKDIITTYFSLFSNKNMFNFSLRKQEQVFDRIVLFTKSLSKDYWFSPDFVVFLACMHEQEIISDLFNKFKEQTNHSIEPYRNFQDIFDSIANSNTGRSSHTPWKSAWESLIDVRKKLLYTIKRYDREHNFQEFQPQGNPIQVDKINLFFDTANNDERMKLIGYESFNTKDFLKTYFSKMEFVSRFSDQIDDKKEKVDTENIKL